MEVFKTKRFKKDVKLSLKRHKDPEKLKTVIGMLKNGEKLPIEYKDHPLQGDYKDTRECHLEPDWLLIYKIESDILRLVGTGTHADLFG